MRRPINHRARTHVPEPKPVVVEVDPVEAEIVEEDIMPFIISHEDEIINYIKDKATKETLKSLSPLLEKLEEAVKQQQAFQQSTPVAAASANPVPMSYEEQLKKLQEASKGRIKEKELKIVERMNKLQARFANIRK
ncbi:hypothetical protein DRF59_18155 [Chryseobacterium flavum]|uniref:Uncharacterized protein n=1 Tax=Chryseobacterium flavum TaxID=415851 RepID=A0A3D9CH29_9FLAO|nr:hypothetical protein [Chryseobacterium flavum]REC65016.1 hypothetical protein DRF59_18155 [Chryseobacterium flavum]